MKNERSQYHQRFFFYWELSFTWNCETWWTILENLPYSSANEHVNHETADNLHAYNSLILVF